jgi:hypothetical protein
LQINAEKLACYETELREHGTASPLDSISKKFREKSAFALRCAPADENRRLLHVQELVPPAFLGDDEFRSRIIEGATKYCGHRGWHTPKVARKESGKSQMMQLSIPVIRMRI